MSRCLFVDINHCKYHFLLHFHPETECLEEKLEAADLLPHLQPSILTSVHGDNDGKPGTLPSNYEHNDCLITNIFTSSAPAPTINVNYEAVLLTSFANSSTQEISG